MTTTMRAEAVTKAFATRGGSLTILNDISLSLDKGEAVAIMGPSGSGKSTLLNILGTLEPPTSGTVAIDDVNPFELNESDLAAFRSRRIGFIFQEHHLLPQCTTLENVLLPTLALAGSTGGPDRASDLLERVGLADRLNHRPAELSGGERQRVAIARSLINEPALVLADEPTGNLDHATADSVATLLFELQRDQEVTLVVVTHSEPLADRCERRLDLVDGKLTPAGS